LQRCGCRTGDNVFIGFIGVFIGNFIRSFIENRGVFKAGKRLGTDHRQQGKSGNIGWTFRLI
ncbi:MAG: hypothetical protein D6742_15805, partial [Cyanobacteria bacterium J069]